MRRDRLKGVMVGAGFFAGFQAEAWTRISAAGITAVADLDRQKAQAFADRWGIAGVYADPAEMFERERPDFVDIVTGPDTHAPLVHMAAEHKVAVVCQKPMAPAYQDCVAMVQACERNGVRLLMHENWRWQPWYREVKRLEDAGLLGRVFHIAFRMRTGDGRGPEPYTVQPYFRQMKRFLVYETLVHFLDTFRFLGGEIGSVYCRLARLNPRIAGEDYTLIHLAFASGVNGVIDANRISGPVPLDPAFGTLHLEGDRAALRMSPEGRLWLTVYGNAEQEHEYRIPKEGYRGDSVKATQEHLVDCLRDGRPCESEGRDYLATVRAVEACYRSAQSGMPVDAR